MDYMEKYVQVTTYDDSSDAPWRMMSRTKQNVEKLQQVKSGNVVVQRQTLDSRWPPFENLRTLGPDPRAPCIRGPPRRIC